MESAFSFTCEALPELDLTQPILYRWPDTDKVTLCHLTRYKGVTSVHAERMLGHKKDWVRFPLDSPEAQERLSNWQPRLGDDVFIYGNVKDGRNAVRGILDSISAHGAFIKAQDTGELLSVPRNLVAPRGDRQQ